MSRHMKRQEIRTEKDLERSRGDQVSMSCGRPEELAGNLGRGLKKETRKDASKGEQPCRQGKERLLKAWMGWKSLQLLWLFSSY